MVLLTLLFVLHLNSYANSHGYTGYKVYEVTSKQPQDTNYLNGVSQKAGFDILRISHSQNDSSHIMVAPRHQNMLESKLTALQFPYKIVVSDVENHLNLNNININQSRYPNPRDGVQFNRYYRYAEINTYLDMLAKKYRQNVVVENIGKSYEGRPIKMIRIFNGPRNISRKSIFIDAGIHAREWIAPATALYIIQQLVQNVSKNRDLMSRFDWIVVPLVNPDGYEYSHTVNRMWRKTRSRNTGTFCYGVDGNRNFGFHWGKVGSSSNSCSDLYRGPVPFSEVETRIVRDVLLSLKGNGKFYLSLHSYGNYILYPWGWTSKLPTTYKDLDEVAAAGVSAISSATGSRYTYGSSTRVLYAAAGGSDDYAFGVAGFPISITMELPAGGSGFDPHPSQIQGFVEEAWVGIRAMAIKVAEKY